MLEALCLSSTYGTCLMYPPLCTRLTVQMGILALFVAFLGLRLYGFVAGDPNYSIADTAYDLLAANAIFLFPRLFAALGMVFPVARR